MLPRKLEKLLAPYVVQHLDEMHVPFTSAMSATEAARALPVYVLASYLVNVYAHGPHGKLAIAKEKIADQKGQITNLKKDKFMLTKINSGLQRRLEDLAEKKKTLQDREINLNQAFYRAFADIGLQYDADMLADPEVMQTALETYGKKLAKHQLNMDTSQVRAHMLTTLAAYDKLADTDVTLPLDELIAKAQTIENAAEREFLRIIRPVLINAVNEDPELKETFEKSGITDFNTATAPKLRAASVDALIYLSSSLAQAREETEVQAKAAEQEAKNNLVLYAREIKTSHPTILPDEPIDSPEQAAVYLRKLAGFAEQTRQTLETRDRNSDAIVLAQNVLVTYAGLMQFPFTTVETYEQAQAVFDNFAYLANDLSNNFSALVKSSVNAHLAGANSTRDTLRKDLSALTEQHRDLKRKYERTNNALTQANKSIGRLASEAAEDEQKANVAEAARAALAAQKQDLESKLATTENDLATTTKEYRALQTHIDSMEQENALLTGAMQDAIRAEQKTRASNTILRHERTEAVKTADAFGKQAAAAGQLHEQLLDTRKDLHAAQAALAEKEKAYNQLFADRNSDPAFHQLRAHYNGFWNGVATADKVEPLADEIYKLAIQHDIKPAELVKLVAAARKKFGDGGIPELIHDELMAAIPKKDLKTVL